MMEQKFDGTPKAELQLDGRKVTRSDVSNDWGSRLQWRVTRDGKEVAALPARTAFDFQHTDDTPGKYEIVLQMWKYVSYRKNPKGEYVDSKYVDVSNAVSYTI